MTFPIAMNQNMARRCHGDLRHSSTFDTTLAVAVRAVRTAPFDGTAQYIIQD